ncbi:MAG: Uma2 family endonuclease [Coleofasciculaceae cyanobacterium]
MATTINPKPPYKPTEQRFIQTGVSWSSFKSIQKGFADSPGVHLFYYQGELEIFSTSPEHEIVKGNIGFLVEDFLLQSEIDFVGTGSFSLEKENVASAQADESYCFGQQKSVPDLAIEVVITSGGTNKLRRYQALGVKEVWFWENGVISLHYLEGDNYSQVSQSKFLPNLDIAKLAQCAAIPSRVQAVRQFRSKKL